MKNVLFIIFPVFISTVQSEHIPVLKQSDPGKYWKLNAAFSGYDVIQGEPMPAVATSVDAGIKNTIFKPVKYVNGHYEWDGVTVYDSLSCEAALKSKVIKTTNEYREFVGEMSKKGGGVGFKDKITVTTSDPSGMISISKDFEISADSAWSNSRSSKRSSAFLSEGVNAISIAYAECVTETVKLQEFSLPTFTNGFKSAVRHLARVSTSTKSKQKHMFQKFVQQFGTHYMSQVTMGARMIETKKYGFKLRQKYTHEQVSHCSKSSSGFNFLWFHKKSEAYRCSAADNEQFKGDSKLVAETSISTYGSKPGKDIADWASKEFSPNPLYMELLPIVNLLDEEVLQDQGIKVNYQALLNWILPMYINYGLTMGLDLKPPQGCGMNDDCPFDKYCVSLDNQGDRLCAPTSSRDLKEARQGWYLNKTDGGKDGYGTVSTWYTTTQNCCLVEQYVKEQYMKCEYKHFSCAKTYDVHYQQMGKTMVAFFPKTSGPGSAIITFMFQEDMAYWGALDIDYKSHITSEKCKGMCTHPTYQPQPWKCSWFALPKNPLSMCFVTYLANSRRDMKLTDKYNYYILGHGKEPKKREQASMRHRGSEYIRQLISNTV